MIARMDVPAPDSRKVPATERVLDHILAEMDAGAIGPGSRVNAARIAKRLGLSAAPVREALGQLAGRGVLDLLPDRGAVIRPIDARDAKHLWEVIAALGSIGLESAALAVANGADTGELAHLFAQLSSGQDDDLAVAFLLRLNEWHWEANRLGGNPYVTVALERIGVTFWDRFLVRFIDVRAHRPGYLANYRRMHEAVLAGDGEAAAAVMRFHARWSMALIADAETRGPKVRRRRVS